MKYLALIVCAAALLTTGCKSCHKSCGGDACTAKKPTCNMACCADGKTDCAHCAKCSAK